MKNNLEVCSYDVQVINSSNYTYSCFMNIKCDVGFNEQEKERAKAHTAITKEPFPNQPIHGQPHNSLGLLYGSERSSMLVCSFF